MEKWYLLITEKFLFWTFWWWEIWSFFESRSWRKRWYLLITEKFLFWTLRWWEIRSFLSQEVDGKMIFAGYREVLILNFSVMGNTIFFQTKSWWKDNIYMVFFSFPWYSRTWEIRFFVQCDVFMTWWLLCGHSAFDNMSTIVVFPGCQLVAFNMLTYLQ